MDQEISIKLYRSGTTPGFARFSVDQDLGSHLKPLTRPCLHSAGSLAKHKLPQTYYYYYYYYYYYFYYYYYDYYYYYYYYYYVYYVLLLLDICKFWCRK